jgi:hypothetical protein
MAYATPSTSGSSSSVNQVVSKPSRDRRMHRHAPVGAVAEERQQSISKAARWRPYIVPRGGGAAVAERHSGDGTVGGQEGSHRVPVHTDGIGARHGDHVDP